MRIEQITPIEIEWNEINGFILTILRIEFQCGDKGFEGEFLGLHFSRSHLLAYVLFVEFEITSPIV